FIDQTGVGGRCEVTDSDGDTVALAPVKGNESIGVDDENWYVVLRSPGEVPAGKYRVACEAQTPDARFAVGPHQSVFGSAATLLGGLGLAFFGVAAAFVVWLVTFLRRRSARRRAQHDPPYGPPPSDQGHSPPGPLPPAAEP